jgi:hypothetical protein
MGNTPSIVNTVAIAAMDERVIGMSLYRFKHHNE